MLPSGSFSHCSTAARCMCRDVLSCAGMTHVHEARPDGDLVRIQLLAELPSSACLTDLPAAAGSGHGGLSDGHHRYRAARRRRRPVRNLRLRRGRRRVAAAGAGRWRVTVKERANAGRQPGPVSKASAQQQGSPGGGSRRKSIGARACNWAFLQQLHVLHVPAASTSDKRQACFWL